MFRIKNIFYWTFMQNGSCQFIYTTNYLAEIKVLHEGLDPGSQPAASQSFLLAGILTRYSPRCYNRVNSSPGSSSIDTAPWESDSFSAAHSRCHPANMKGTYIYYLQTDYRAGAALYNGFPAPQFPRVVAQLEERTGKSAVCLCP